MVRGAVGWFRGLRLAMARPCNVVVGLFEPAATLAIIAKNRAILAGLFLAYRGEAYGVQCSVFRPAFRTNVHISRIADRAG